MKKSNIKKDYFWNTIGVFAQNAISPLLLIVITRINGIYDSGVFSFAFSLSIIFWAFGMWGGRTYQVSDVKHEFSNRSYVMVRFVSAIFMILGAIIFSLVNNYDITKSAIIVALVLFKTIESIADAIYGILQLHNHLFIAGKSLLYKALGGFILFVIVDVLTKNIFWSCISIVVINTLIIFFYDGYMASKFETLKMKKKQISGFVNEAIIIMKRCSPVFAVLFLSMFSLNIPRYFVDMYHNDQIGYFGILAMPITLIALLMSFILQPNIVGLSKNYAKKNYYTFNRTVKKIASATTVLGLSIVFVMFVVGIPVFELMFGINFDNYKTALMIMVVGGVINALVSVFMSILIVMRRFKAQFYILLFTNIILALLSSIIVMRRGSIGGASLFAIINFVQLVMLIIVYESTLHKMDENKQVFC